MLLCFVLQIRAHGNIIKSRYSITLLVAAVLEDALLPRRCRWPQQLNDTGQLFVTPASLRMRTEARVVTYSATDELPVTKPLELEWR